MKVILSGYEGSKQILSASSYLIDKYLKGFEVFYLNYGDYKGKLYSNNNTVSYVILKDKQERVQDWAKDIKGFLEGIKDDYIIFALDDYLLAQPLDRKLYDTIELDGVDMINLCKYSDLTNKKYTCTTQYAIWKRKLLIDILSRVDTPWHFEDYGSPILNGMFKDIKHVPALDYPPNSCLSNKWKGVRLEGNEHDEDKIKELL